MESTCFSATMVAAVSRSGAETISRSGSSVSASFINGFSNSGITIFMRLLYHIRGKLIFIYWRGCSLNWLST